MPRPPFEEKYAAAGATAAVDDELARLKEEDGALAPIAEVVSARAARACVRSLDNPVDSVPARTRPPAGTVSTMLHAKRPDGRACGLVPRVRRSPGSTGSMLG